MKIFIEKLPHLKRFQVYLSWEPIEILPQFRFGPRSIFACHTNEEDLITIFSSLATLRQLSTNQLAAFHIETPISPPLLPSPDTNTSSLLPTLNITTRILTDPQTRTLSHLYEKEIIRFDCHIDSEDVRIVGYQPGSVIFSIEITDDKHLSELVNPVHSIFETMSYFERSAEYLQNNCLSLRTDHVPLFLYHYCPELLSKNYSNTIAYPLIESEAMKRHATFTLGPFRDIKPIPSSDWQDVSEIWFCHNDNVTIAESQRNTIQLKPRDVFIDDTFVILHSYDTIPIQPTIPLQSFTNPPIDHCFKLFSSSTHDQCKEQFVSISPLQTRFIPPFITIYSCDEALSLQQLHYQAQFIPLRLNPSTQRPEPYSFPPDFFQGLTPHNIPPTPWSSTMLSTPFQQHLTPIVTPARQDTNYPHDSTSDIKCSSNHHHHHHPHDVHHTHINQHTNLQHFTQLLAPSQPTPFSLFVQALQILLNAYHTSLIPSPSFTTNNNNNVAPLFIPEWIHFFTHKWYNIIYKLLFRQETFVSLSFPIFHSLPISLQSSSSSSPFVSYLSTSPSIGEAMFALSLQSCYNAPNNPLDDIISFLPLIHQFLTSLQTSPSIDEINQLVIITCYLFHLTFKIEQLDIVAFFKCSLEGFSTLFESILPPALTLSSSSSLTNTPLSQSLSISICDWCCRHHPEHCLHVFPYTNLSRASKQFQALSSSTQSLYPISPYYNIFHMYSIESTLIAALLKLSQTKLISRFFILDHSQTNVALYLTITSTQIYLQSSNTPRSDLVSSDEFRQLTMQFYPGVKVQYHHFSLIPSISSTQKNPLTSYDPQTNLKTTTLDSFLPLFALLSQQSVPVTYLYWDADLINAFATICSLRKNELPPHAIQRHLEQNNALSTNRSLADVHSKTAQMLAKLQLAPNQLSQKAIAAALTAQLAASSAQTDDIAPLLFAQLDTTYLYKPILPKSVSLRED